MNGVPVRIQIEQSSETIYLSTRRSGEKGQALQSLRRALRDKELQLGNKAARVQVLATQAEKCEGDIDRLNTILNEQEAKLTEIATLSDEIKELTLQVVMAALLPNYSEDEATKLTDAMSDAQLRGCVKAIEIGEEPKDFFIPRAIPQSVSTT